MATRSKQQKRGARKARSVRQAEKITSDEQAKDAHAAPRNRLVNRDPAETVAACARMIDWLAYLEQPFRDNQLDLAEADILHSVVDALEHVERQIGGLWAKAAEASGGAS